jgi:hypothetical protein
VKVVDASIAKVDAVPLGPVTVMDVVEIAVTSPPMPPGIPGGIGIDDEWFPRAFAVTDVNARAVGAWVDALATPTPVAATPRAMADATLACLRALLRVTLLTDGNLLSVSIGGKSETYVSSTPSMWGRLGWAKNEINLRSVTKLLTKALHPFDFGHTGRVQQHFPASGQVHTI